MQATGSTLAILALLVVGCGASSPRERTSRNPPHDSVADRDAEPDSDERPPLPDGPTSEGGNHRIRGFDEAKRTLQAIYEKGGHHIDLYCGCTFLPVPGQGMRVDLEACGYKPASEPQRAERIEWEHAVPAAALGRTFAEWTSGDPRCVDGKGKHYKGRKCARRSAEFSRMEADLHNLFPVVGEVNALRGDLPMGLLDPGAKPGSTSIRFGACASAIERGAFQPRSEVRGDLARAYKYMDASYPERHLLDAAHRAIFDRWDSEDPPDAWERERNQAILARQGNANPFIR